jgi:hypothetical protein
MLRYPAIAEVDEPYRNKGVPLFAEHKSLEFLMERPKLYTDAAWESLYQGAPYVVCGLSPGAKPRGPKGWPTWHSVWWERTCADLMVNRSRSASSPARHEFCVAQRHGTASRGNARART